MKICDLFCRDLLLRSKVKEAALQAGVTVRIIRSVADYESRSLEPAPSIFVNANEYEAELKELTDRIAGSHSLISCFVSHVDTAIIDKARMSGITDIRPRSTFFGGLAEKLKSLT